MSNLNNIEINSNNHQAITKIIREMMLHDGTWVDEHLYKSVLQQIETRLHALDRNKVYTAKQFCGKEFWNSLGKYERIMAGKYLVDMVKNGLLPLSFVESKHEYPKKYRLK